MEKREETKFWDLNGYKVDTQRILDNIQQIDLLNKYFDERAKIEADYAKKLKTWNEKMIKALEASTMYGSHQKGLIAITAQSEKIANHHQQIHDKIHSDCSTRLKEWKKGAYHTKLMGGYKEVDTLNKEFQKAQKNWLKMAAKIDEQKQRYHRVCFEETQNNTRAKQDERNIEKDKYQNVLNEVNEMAPTYIGDMRRIHQKSQNIENRKIQFFQQILGDYISIIDNDRMKPIYSTISQAERSAIDNINSAADLDVWNKKIGLSDDCEIPAFEEFDPAVPIQRGRRTTVKKSTTENGTIKSINSLVHYSHII